MKKKNDICGFMNLMFNFDLMFKFDNNNKQSYTCHAALC